MNLFWFITNAPKDCHEKAYLFLKMTCPTLRRVKYRDAICEKIRK